MSKHIPKPANSWVRCNYLHGPEGCWKTAHRLWESGKKVFSQQGFSLLEEIAAVAITGLLTAQLLYMFVAGAGLIEGARAGVAALYCAQQLLESIKGMPYCRVGNPRGSGSSSITLASDTDAGDLEGELVAITAGRGSGQVRRILSYDSAARVAAIDAGMPWDDAGGPDATSTYLICSDGFLGVGIARGGRDREIALADEGAADGLYDGYYVAIAGGTGAGQTRRIASYNGTSAPEATAFLEREWDVAPDEGSLYRLYRYDYEIRASAGGCGLKTVAVTVSYQSGKGLKPVTLTTDKPDR